MNKSKLISIFIFCLLVIIIDKTLGWGLAEFSLKYQYDNRLEKVIGKTIDADVIILGSSRALNNYAPSVIEKETGKTAYNLGFSGSEITFHLTILKILLQEGNQPEHVIYNLDDYSTLVDMDGIIFRKKELYPYVYNSTVNAIVAEQLKKSEWATMLSASYRNNVNLSDAINFLISGREEADFQMTNINAYGANLMVGSEGDDRLEFVSKVPSLAEYEESEEHVEALKEIVQICKEKNIELTLVMPPLLIKSTEGFVNRIEELTGQTVIDLSNGVSEKKYFFNRSHLNKRGAQRFTFLLTQQL